MRGHVFARALLVAIPFLAVQAQAQDSIAAATEACMKEMRAGLKAGQKLTEQQRMVAEAQCRARAEQASYPAKK